MTYRCWHLGALGVVLGVFACESPAGLEVAIDHLIQTRATKYTLEPQEGGWGVEIPYRFTNRTGETVYLANCWGVLHVRLERQMDGAWQTAWSPPIFQCDSPRIGIGPELLFQRTLHVTNPPLAGDTASQAQSDPSGTYRIVWDEVYFSNREPVPLEMRVSNAFRLLVPE
jgi:hypothetical protein